MAYEGRNRKRVQRDLRKGKVPKGMTPTEGIMIGYGNKRLAGAAAIRTPVLAHRAAHPAAK